MPQNASHRKTLRQPKAPTGELGNTFGRAKRPLLTAPSLSLGLLTPLAFVVILVASSLVLPPASVALSSVCPIGVPSSCGPMASMHVLRNQHGTAEPRGFGVSIASREGQYRAPQTSGTGWFIQWTLCLANDTLFSGNYGCSFNDAPQGMAWDPLTGDMYVTNDGSNGLYGSYSNVLIVNGTNDSVVASVAVGEGPCAATFDPLNDQVYVANCNADDRVSVINGMTGKNLGNISVGYEPDAIAVDTVNGEVYVANFNGTSTADSNVSVIDGATDKTVGSVTVGVSSPNGIVYDAATGDFYVVGFSNVTVINGSTNRVVNYYSLPYSVLNGEASPIAYDSVNGDLYIGGSSCGCLMVVDAANGALVASLPMENPIGANGVGPVLVDPSTGNILADLTGGAPTLGNVSVIDGATNTILGNVTMPGSELDGLARDGASGNVYVSTYDTGSLSILSQGTGYPLSFKESGLPAGTGWSVTTNGISQGSNTSSISTIEPNGTYAYTVGAVSGYTASPSSGSATVNGVSQTVAITFTPSTSATYAVTFSESGLPSGTTWSVTLNSQTLSSTTSTITFSEPNGTYSYTVGAVSGYTASPSSGTVTVNGAPPTVAITFTPSTSATYAVTFSESGLPPGTSWSVTLNGQTLSSGTSTILFSEPNGTYSYTVGAVSGYTVSPSSGSVSVNGASQTVAIAFTPTSYLVWFTETGLPAGTSWSATLNAQTLTSTGSTITFSETDGGYAYTVGSVNGYIASPSSGTVAVNGASQTVYIAFNPSTAATYPVTFSEAGLPAGTNWSVALGGSMSSSTSSTVTFHVVNGSYAFTVGNVPGYTASPLSGSLTVNGAPVSQPITFSHLPPDQYSVVFTEFGLPSGTTWLVTLGGQSLSSVGTTITYVEPNGTYAFTVGAEKGFTATPASGKLIVSGSSDVTSITFTPVTPINFAVTFTEAGLPSGTAWSVTLNGTTQATNRNSITFVEGNGTYAFTIGPVPGYRANLSSGSVIVSGKSVTQAITFVPTGSGRYSVTFLETGLPAGTAWSVTFNGTTQSSTATSVVFTNYLNNTYTYSVGALTGYTATPASGSMTISGDSKSVSITFTPSTSATYAVTFTESGLPSGTSWSVTVGTTTHISTGSTIAFTEVNGTYSYTVGAVAGYTATPSSGSVTVNGVAKAVSIAFAKASAGTTYAVTFSESGLPSGTNWWVTLDGSTMSFTTATITFQEANGSYSFTIGTVNGYTGSPSSGMIKVNGAPVSQPITLTSSTSPGNGNQTTGFLGLPGYEGYVLIGTLGVLVVIAVALAVVKRQGRNRRPEVGYPPAQSTLPPPPENP